MLTGDSPRTRVARLGQSPNARNSKRENEMGKILSLLIGAIVVVAGLILLFAWWYELVIVFKGILPLVLLAGGVIAVFAGIGEFKDVLKSKK